MKAIIAGTAIEQIINKPFKVYHTEYGDVDASIDGDILFILRHRSGHTDAPHLINYLANVSLLESMDVSHVITTHAVGSITERLLPTNIGLVSDFIDFTQQRPFTFFDGVKRPLRHVPMNDVFDDELRFQVIRASVERNLRISPALTYITTNGPRLESKAEIRAYRSWGADVVGMTLNPEVNLIHELGIKLSSICFSINWAAGLDEEGISFIEGESRNKLTIRVLDIALDALRSI